MVRGVPDWRDDTLPRLRIILRETDPVAIEERKWRKPNQPEGVPVWSHDGIICIANSLKRAVRLAFPKGARINDPKKLINTRLDSRTVRAVDFRGGEPIDASALRHVIREAVALNAFTHRA